MDFLMSMFVPNFVLYVVVGKVLALVREPRPRASPTEPSRRPDADGEVTPSQTDAEACVTSGADVPDVLGVPDRPDTRAPSARAVVCRLVIPAVVIGPEGTCPSGYPRDTHCYLPGDRR